jgi:hypothetical protein
VQSALHILIFWGLAFATLGLALLLLNVFFALIEDDLTLHSLGKETVIAAVASFIEGASVWAIVTFLPLAGPFMASRLFVPALVVGICYKTTHLEDWSRYEIILLLLFQLVIAAFGTSLFLGHFAAAFGVLFVSVVCLAVPVAFVRGL